MEIPRARYVPQRPVPRLWRALRAVSAAALALGCTTLASAQNGFVNWETPHVSPLALTPSGNKLLAVNTPDNHLEILDVSGANASNPRRLKAIPVGLDPVSVRARSETEAWVVNQISDSISIIDLATGRVTGTLFTGDEPADVAFSGTRAFVTCAALNQVQVYDLNNLAAPPTIIAIQGADPRALAVSADGSKVYVAIFGSGNNTTSLRRQEVSDPAGPYGGVNPPPNSGLLYNPPQNPANAAAPAVGIIVRRNGAGQWFDDNARNWSQFVSWNLADNDVAIINATTLGVTYAKGMLSTVMALGLKPDGTVTTVGLDARNEVRYEPIVRSKFVRIEMGSFNPASPVPTTVVDLNPHLLYTTPSLPQAFRDLSIGDPRGIVWHPTSGRAYVSGMGSDNVIVTDAAGTRYAEIAVGKGPTGLVISPTGAIVYALSKFGSSISAINTTTNTEVARVPLYDPTPAAIKVGRPLLYDTHRSSGLGQAACASCHIDGRSDFLAWDLGDPSGATKQFNQQCFQSNFCFNWHPMKGPMVTQVLQGIIGAEPLHWRGDRENLAAFAPAFVGLQGLDTQPTVAEMQQFTDFITTIKYPPNPTRSILNTVPASVPTFGGTTGDPTNGLNFFTNIQTLGNFKCIQCHTLPIGSNRQIDEPFAAAVPQLLKMAQLRGLSRKVGFDKTSQQSIRGFGFNHDSEFGTLDSLLQGSRFDFGPPPVGDQVRHDVEAFLYTITNDTHPSIGRQVMFDGSNNNDPAAVSLLNTLVSLTNGNTIGLVAKGRRGGKDRGWALYTGTTMQSDRHGETISVSDLRTGAAPGSEIVFTAVPVGSQGRIGLDRDGDGWYDSEELAACSNPGDPLSVPGSRGSVDMDANLIINVADIFGFLSLWFASDPRADFDGLNGTNVADIFAYLSAWFAGGCS